MGQMLNKERKTSNKKAMAYLMIASVVILWGITPTINKYMNTSYSVAFRLAVIAFISAISLLFICWNKLKNLNSKYLKTAIPTGIFVSLASLVQKIGLWYTTPAKYAFLENFSCVVVPLILFFTIKKKPSLMTIIACVLCLVGSFVLAGNFSGGAFTFGLGEILCALAGVFYGINIAYTGMRIKKFDTMLYLFVQLSVSAVVGLITAVAFAIIPGANGQPIEAIKFSWDFEGLLLLLVLSLICNVLCWFLRTNAMKYVNPTAVSIIMPFSSVLASIMSIILGYDVFSYELLIGGSIALFAVILSGFADIKYKK